jgi:solute carrier family 10 (sodium/bile acid cotransporter), member 3/5
MCPFLVLVLAILITPLVVQAFTLHSTFHPAKLQVKIGQEETVGLALESNDFVLNAATDVQIVSEHESIAQLAGGQVEFLNHTNGVWYGQFNVSGVFLGFTNINVSVAETRADASLPVVVTRPKRVIDTVFTASIITLVSLLYVNFGAALDVTVVKGIMRRPIGPLIGFLSQFLFMPLMSFGLGHFIFKDYPNFQLGLFFTGVSPAGGASNIWTLILGGNINLSLAMTTISTFAAFGE